MSDETTTDQLAEIEGQSEPIHVREGRWRTRSGEIRDIRPCEPLRGAYYVWPWTDGFMTYQDNGRNLAAESDNDLVEYLGPIEPQPQPEPVPVQVCEGRWRTRSGEIRNVTATPEHDGRAIRYPWWDAQYLQTWTADGKHYRGSECPADLVEYLGPIEQLEKVITPDDVAGEVLASVWDHRQAERTIADLQHRLDVVSKEWAEQAATINGLQQQLEAVKAELVQVSRDRYQLQIELDAVQQVPQAVSDRFEEGWDAGTSQAVETIAEWTEPIRHLIDAADNMAETERASNLAADIIRALPAIMRHLTGLAEED